MNLRKTAVAVSLVVGLVWITPIGHTAIAQEPCAESTLYFSQDDNGNGLYSIDTATGAATLVGEGETGTDSATIGLTESDDPNVLWGSTWEDFAIINADGSNANVLATDFSAEALGYDSGSDTLYGGINEEFFTVDPVTGLRTGDLADPPIDLEALAADAATGLVYGLDGGDDTQLYFYDPGSLSWNTVGDIGLTWEEPGLAFDPNNEWLYALNGDDENVYRIDITTAEATLVGNLGLDDFDGGGLGFIAGDCPPPTTPTTPTTDSTTTTPAPAPQGTVRPRFTG